MEGPEVRVYHLRQRTPTDLVARLKGQPASLPIGQIQASIRIGPIVQASLRTKEPGEARVRHVVADGALKRFWQRQRDGTHSDSRAGVEAEARERHHHSGHALNAASAQTQSVASPTHSEVSALTVGDLFERWSADRADKRAPNTIKRYRGGLRSFEAFARGRDVRTSTGNDVFAWAVRRRDVEGISPRAINKNDRVAGSSVFRWAAGRARPRRQQRGSRMPRFHLNVHDGKSIIDEEGTELPDWQTARIEAIHLAGNILRDAAQSIALGEDWRIEVTDHTGLILFQMTFQVVEAPVIPNQIAQD